MRRSCSASASDAREEQPLGLGRLRRCGPSSRASAPISRTVMTTTRRAARRPQRGHQVREQVRVADRYEDAARAGGQDPRRGRWLDASRFGRVRRRAEPLRAAGPAARAAPRPTASWRSRRRRRRRHGPASRARRRPQRPPAISWSRCVRAVPRGAPTRRPAAPASRAPPWHTRSRATSRRRR